jgi:hypothetical protein
MLMCFGTVASSMVAEEVEVTAVKFANVRPPNGGNGTWLEADIALNVRATPGSAGAMVSRVRVILTLGFELPGGAGGDRHIEHYRAEAECVALDAGRADVRFYLPPELVKRDQLHGEPKYWGVEVAVAGRPLPAVHAAYSATLATADQQKNFQARAATSAALNDGLLQPQYGTVFAGEYPRATPSFVRREAR